MFILSNLLVVLAAFAICGAPVPAAAADGFSEETTRVTPHMEVPIEPGRNVVFCSTFQITWNQMKNDMIKDDIRLEKPLDLVRHLNRELSTRADMSEQDYLAMAGFGSDNIADAINRALKEKFGDDAPVVDDEYNADDVILAYAFFLKELEFENAFEDFRDPMTFYGQDENETRIESFGLYKYSEERHSELRGQVEIIDYRNHDDFIVRLKSKHPDDEIILARLRPGETLLETYDMVSSRIAGNEPEHLAKNDFLQIPKLDFSIDHQFSSLIGLHVSNTGFEDYFVAEARQDIRFRLDECGATAKSEGIFALKKGPPIDFKVLFFHGPFMLYLKKKDGKYPYLAVWVENGELMVESG